MYRELYQYFLQHRQLVMPGIGTFLLERKPASADFPNKLINAPSFSIALHHTNAQPTTSFFAWLAAMLQVTERDAVISFNDFAFDLKKQLREGSRITWNGVGVLSPGLAGEIRFESALRDAVLETPVKAEKILRDRAEHTVRVGEDEKTSAQMIEYLNQPKAKRHYWWAWALAAGLLLIMFIGWYLSEKGLTTHATGNGKTITAPAATPTYQAIP